MLPSLVSYNSHQAQEMDSRDMSPLRADGQLMDDFELADSNTLFDFDPNELLQSSLFDNSDDDEIQRIPSSSSLEFDYDLDQKSQNTRDPYLKSVQAASYDHQHQQQYEAAQDDSQMVLDSNGFPVKKKVRRRPTIPEESRPRRIPGLVKQKTSRNIQVPPTNYSDTMYVRSQGAVNYGNGMPMNGMDEQYIMNVDVNMNTNTIPIQGDTDVDMSPESNEFQRVHVPGDLRTYNDAIVNLSKYMKRSAMSRQLVKQLSGQSVSKTNSTRSISSGSRSTYPPSHPSSRQNSARSLASKQNSNQSLLHQDSGRTLMSQDSRRGLVRHPTFRSIDDNGLASHDHGSPYAARLPNLDAQHLAQPSINNAPGRAVFRHNSHNAVLDNRQSIGFLSELDDSAPDRTVFRHNSSNAVLDNRHSIDLLSELDDSALDDSALDDSALGLAFDGKRMHS
jgi:hypothetical protein